MKYINDRQVRTKFFTCNWEIIRVTEITFHWPVDKSVGIYIRSSFLIELKRFLQIILRFTAESNISRKFVILRQRKFYTTETFVKLVLEEIEVRDLNKSI